MDEKKWWPDPRCSPVDRVIGGTKETVIEPSWEAPIILDPEF